MASAVLGMEEDRDVPRAHVALVPLHFILRDPKSQKAADDPTGGTVDRRAAERRHDRSSGDTWRYSRDGERPILSGRPTAPPTLAVCTTAAHM